MCGTTYVLHYFIAAMDKFNKQILATAIRKIRMVIRGQKLKVFSCYSCYHQRMLLQMLSWKENIPNIPNKSTSIYREPNYLDYTNKTN